MAVVIERADAIERVQQQAAYDQPPVLTSPQIEALVDAAERVRDDELPAYDLNQATAAAWDLKAALAANRYDLSIDRQELTRSQIVKHCLAMAGQYRGKRLGTLPRPA